MFRINRTMKKAVFLFLTTIALSVSAQESILLRHNYNQGDKYAIKIESKQDLGDQGSMNMYMSLEMTVAGVTKEDIKTVSKTVSVAIDLTQAGITTSYDSSIKDEELGERGLMVKSQFKPVMKSVIYTTLDHLGNTINAKAEPSYPGVEQFIEDTKVINYPEEKICEGSSWTSKSDTQNIVYTVSSITNGNVTLDITGNVVGMSSAIKGKAIVDSYSGMLKNTTLEVTVSNQEITIVAVTNMTATKI